VKPVASLLSTASQIAALSSLRKHWKHSVLSVAKKVLFVRKIHSNNMGNDFNLNPPINELYFYIITVIIITVIIIIHMSHIAAV